MIYLKDFLECISYRITEGTEYMWQCYGPNARSLEFWNGITTDEGCSVYCVFDTQTQFVYEVEAWDYFTRREYRWIHPGYIEGHAVEAINRNVKPFESFDGNKFIDLEVVEDILEKATAIANKEGYDTRIMVPVDIPDNEIFILMTMAHERDITLNELVNEIMWKKVNAEI